MALIDCREFREKHVGYVDDTLPAVVMEAMHRHARSCYRCSRHDTAVRRGLLLVHNLPQIEPSADFMGKLADRIAALDAAGDDVELPSPYRLTTGAFAALAAGLTLFGYIALETANHFGTPQALLLPPVVATTLAQPAPTPTSSAYMAGISTGMPIWPAVMMMDAAPRRMADVELQQASLR
ncbi:MAG TPA: hypothetical protein VGH98_02155 [Gemmatimonadaceae bacterium]|jgi:hypothetical protein